MIIWLLRRQYTHVSHPFTRPSIYSVLVVFNDSMNVLHSQFHVHSCQCNCTLLHWWPILHITSARVQLHMAALPRHPGPSFSPGQLSAQVTTGTTSRQSEARSGEWRPMRGRGVTQRPALGSGNQAGVQGQPRPGLLSWPDRLCYNSAKTLWIWILNGDTRALYIGTKHLLNHEH